MQNIIRMTRIVIPVVTPAIILVFDIASTGFFDPRECPTVATVAKDNPYGIIIKNWPNATRIT